MSKLEVADNVESMVVEVGKTTPYDLMILFNNVDCVCIVPKNSTIESMFVLNEGVVTENNQEINPHMGRDHTDVSRSERSRGPYIHPEAYARLKTAADNNDMTIQEMLDELLLKVLNDEGEINQQYSVLRNEFDNM